MTLAEILQATGGRALSGGSQNFTGVGTDTRVDLTGKLFVALKGEAYDAHDFLDKAVAAGAAGLLVHALSEKFRALTERVAIVEVKDTLEGLQSLGRFQRRKMPAKILAITGTNGKTTTKEFAAAIIGSKRNVHYSKGSFNNHWGVPLSLLDLKPEHEVALIEMGMNHAGELTTLCQIAEPDVVMVTMVGRGHLEGLGSVEGVAAAKAEIYAASPQAARIFNIENEHTRRMAERYAKPGSLSFAELTSPQAATADVAMEVVSLSPESMRVRGRIKGVAGEAEVAVFGAQNVTNLMAASALALFAGLSAQEIWAALPLCRTIWGRNQWVRLPSGARVLFDGYNANPESMAAAIDNFRRLQVKGRKFAVLAEMKEMGAAAASVHRELGSKVATAGFDGVSFFGPSASDFEAGLKAGGFSKTTFVSGGYEQSLASRMLPVLEGNDIVLMKGSRSMQLEKALLDLKPVDFQAKK